jgi:hypothetical protein
MPPRRDTRTRLTGILLALAACALATGAQRPALAQPRPAPTAPQPAFTVSGWRFEAGPNGIHFYFCASAACSPSAKASYQVLTGAPQMTFEEFQADKRKVVEMLKARMPPGAQIVVDGMKEEDMGIARVMSERRRLIQANGGTTHSVSSVIVGRARAISFIFSSAEEKDIAAHLPQFLLPLATLTGR